MDAVNKRTIKDIQNDFAHSNGYPNEVIWDLLHADQKHILEEKIMQLIPNQESGNNAIAKMRETLLESIWSQNNRSSKDCCMIFVDEQGRVYSDWKSYLNENLLPTGNMVAPSFGVYDFDVQGDVLLKVTATPASSTFQKALKVADTGSIVTGIAAAAVPIASLVAIPVAAPVMAFAGAVGLITGGYNAVRSGGSLIDRHNHEQSISLADRQARNSWLGITGAIFGAGAFRATKAMTTAATAGKELSAATELFVNTMNISTIMLSGAGVTSGVFDLIFKYKDNEKIELLDLVQLSASLVLFTHSVSNFRLASRIVNETQSKTIQDYRKNLSNRQRRMFDKMAKETIRIHGEKTGKIDIIRNVNDVPSKQYLNDLYKVNKNLNKQNIRPSFVSGQNGAADGIVALNNDVRVGAQILRSNVEHTLAQVQNAIPQAHPDVLTASSSGAIRQTSATATALFETSINNTLITGRTDILRVTQAAGNLLASGVRSLLNAKLQLSDGTTLILSSLITDISMFERIINVGTFEDVICAIVDNMSVRFLRFFVNLTQLFIEMTLSRIEKVLGSIIPTESILHQFVRHYKELYSNLTIEELEHIVLDIIDIVKNYYLSFNPIGDRKRIEKCTKCRGSFITTL